MGVQIRVMTFNLATGVDPAKCSWVDRKLALHVDEINERQPDIACFQEVDRRTGRSQGVDQVEIIKTRTHLKYDVFTGVSYDGGYYGDAILSRWQPTSFNNRFIVDSSLPLPVPGYRHNVVHTPIPMATFRIYGIPIRIRSIHYPGDDVNAFGWNSPNTWHHQKAAMEGLLISSWPFQLDTIIGGDFNAGPPDPSLAPLMQHYRETQQTPRDPLIKTECFDPGLDYILHLGENLTALSGDTYDGYRGGNWQARRQFSDHPVVIATFGVAPVIESRFRATSDWCARSRGVYRAGWPTMEWQLSEPYLLYDHVLLRPDHVTWRDVPATAQPASDNRTRFTAAHDFARANGYEHGFPNFHQADYGSGTVYGTFLVERGTAAEFRDVPVGELGLPDPPFDIKIEHWFRGAARYAREHGFVAGMPTGHSTNYGAGHVCGIFLYRGDKLRRQIEAGELFTRAPEGAAIGP